MKRRKGNRFRVFARGSSLRRRVAYSLAMVRIILVPVIFLAVFYLFRMGRIVDRIVTVDAPAATLAGQVSIDMLQARRSERNYLLLHDPSYLQENRESAARVKETLGRMVQLEPADRPAIQQALEAVQTYEQQFAAAVSALQTSEQEPGARIQAVVRAYEQELNDLLKTAGSKKRAQLVEELRRRVDSFDAQISETARQVNPTLGRVTAELHTLSREVLDLASAMNARNWQRVEEDHRQARNLIADAEWALGSVSALTFVLSVWISFVLPREAVQPLVSLREAVDRAAAGNYEVEFDIAGEGEVVQLAASVRNLVAHLRAAP